MLKAKSVITWLDFVHFVCIYAVFDKNIYFADEKVIFVKDVLIRKLFYKEELSKFRR